MILTGSEIENRVRSGEIVISPFSHENVNPNSYNFRLHDQMKVYEDDVIDVRTEASTRTIEIGPEGYELQPMKLYLASTIETMGSTHFVPTYAARSSIARLGMFINLSAPLGDIGFVGRWTLQLYALNRIRVYPGMNIGQMMFWNVKGDIELYSGKYQGATEAFASRIFMDFEKTPRPQPLVVPNLAPFPVMAAQEDVDAVPDALASGPARRATDLPLIAGGRRVQ
ncbi:dCTP deaminase [Pseudomonas ficuserectae]|uniref:Deoxycytidine triphosphate deaminase n=2 Tax=Pseudomonas amygdali pv. lachrymans TaxID=53707 RepID=A0AB37QY77_PSEAV|nr:dCTP deaminase [Pseudomonas amygdali]ARA80962.1 dCTP deaminase [Pseudomonas amygdali pv. lachrymans]AXH56459.1 dCTP deaminase [Pseudomonas amygdali pv. lachrymans str. M301315]KKY59611.1 deoxycytidine triphosphate deaminase [Pseudomonas amygdali pv. lachrymans]KPB97780.1 Deoxycytidine triphosphate deaminase [Pseudomonas amygdali pv. lachrymans]KPC19094.1 Deoxycytidine triphosphate deaminase [Pseudomonas amygdali pv. lachrymans]